MNGKKKKKASVFNLYSVRYINVHLTTLLAVDGAKFFNYRFWVFNYDLKALQFITKFCVRT